MEANSHFPKFYEPRSQRVFAIITIYLMDHVCPNIHLTPIKES